MTNLDAILSNDCPVCEAEAFQPCIAEVPHLARRRLKPWPMLPDELVDIVTSYREALISGLDLQGRDPLHHMALFTLSQEEAPLSTVCLVERVRFLKRLLATHEITENADHG